jgi:hypothetical protein
MSGSRRNTAPAVSRDYKATPDDCARRALELLLKASLNSQTRRGGSHDLTDNSTPKAVKNGPRTTEQEET